MCNSAETPCVFCFWFHYSITFFTVRFIDWIVGSIDDKMRNESTDILHILVIVHDHMDNTHKENITQASSFPKQSTAYFPAIDSLKNCLFFFSHRPQPILYCSNNHDWWLNEGQHVYEHVQMWQASSPGDGGLGYQM